MIIIYLINLFVTYIHTDYHSSDHQEAASLLLSDSPLLILNDLISFSFQIAQAMDFLSSRKVRLVSSHKSIQITPAGGAKGECHYAHMYSVRAEFRARL